MIELLFFILKAIGVTEMLYVSNASWKKLCTLVLKLLFRKYNDYFTHDVYCHKVLMETFGSDSFRFF